MTRGPAIPVRSLGALDGIRLVQPLSHGNRHEDHSCRPMSPAAVIAPRKPTISALQRSLYNVHRRRIIAEFGLKTIGPWYLISEHSSYQLTWQYAGLISYHPLTIHTNCVRLAAGNPASAIDLRYFSTSRKLLKMQEHND
jgi:hypothetical protein